MNENEKMANLNLRSNFKGGPLGLLKFAFSLTEVKIEAKMNKKLIFAFFGTALIFAVAISVIAVWLAFYYSTWVFLMMLLLPLLICFGFLEINEKLTIDSKGISSSGVIWPCPCKMTWTEILKIENTALGVMFYKVGTKKKVLIPNTPEVAFVINYYSTVNGHAGNITTAN